MEKKKNKLILVILASVIFATVGVFVFSPNFVSADSNTMLWGSGAGSFQQASGLGSNDPRILAAAIIRILLGFMGLIALGLILYGGWLWMTSAGDAAQIDKAKKVLIGAVIGLIIILMSFAIASFVINKLYAATGAGGGSGLPSCDISKYNTCSGCQLCTTDTSGNYVWVPGGLACGTSCSIVPGPSAVNCDGDTTNNNPTFTCDINSTAQGICDTAYPASPPGTYYCEPSSCTCKSLSNVGDPCSASTTACVADDLKCMSDLKCNTGSCLCEGSPVIDWITPADAGGKPYGAPGNFITIGGRFFGSTTGEVKFWDGAGFNVTASFPSAVNNNCQDFWSDNQVIVIVPAGIPVQPTGYPIKIIRADGLADETNNTRGPSIPNFDINSTVLPGLCQLNPNNGPYGTTVVYYGINFQTTTIANFGSPSSFVAAQGSAFSLPTQGQATVPSINIGQTTTYASSSNGISNTLYFSVTASQATGPYITSFEPAAGPPKQYVTIYGSGFGNAQGNSKVYFGPPTGTEANYNFPEVCADGVWKNNQVVVKVPDSLGLGNYVITMVIESDTINTSSLSPSNFTVDNSNLAPGLCKISPTMAPNNTPIKLWGEYFGLHNDTDSIVRFHLNQDQSGALSAAGPVIFWGQVSGADQVEVLIHPLAASGPVRIVKAGPSVSNGLNLTIGQCSKDADCGALNFCCAAGSFAAGRCVDDANKCFSNIPSSVFEWDFNTALATTTLGISCDGDLTTSGCQANQSLCPPGQTCNSSCVCVLGTPDSCSGYNSSQCLASTLCPNSPGECSANTGSASKVVGTCPPSDCNGTGGCGTTKTCNYDGSLDRCTTGNLCDDKNSTFKDAAGKAVTAYCAFYDGSNPLKGRWHIDTSMSCPTNWRRIPGNKCVNISDSCNICPSDEKCMSGKCTIDKDICPEKSSCVGSQCVQVSSGGCECCCEIGQDARDCCNGLKCDGDCGSDASGPDTNTFGYCSGCASAPDPDAACNCAGTSGKYCDTSSSAAGICRDCAELSTNALCQAHSGPTTCCIDDNNGDKCRGNKNGTLLTGGLCAYYDCQAPPTNNKCDSANPISKGPYSDTGSCDNGCKNNSIGSGLGKSCASLTATNCDLMICGSPFSCLTAGGAPPAYPGDCGTCCCDPRNDQCGNLNNNGTLLVCKPDISPCGGVNRGLCCGCSNNNDCGNPMITGCGMDTCCRARPSVISTAPADGKTDICRNTLITATFDQQMNIASFGGNVILAGDYDQDACPPDTQYITLNNIPPPKPANIFVRAYRRVIEMIKIAIRTILPTKFAEAYQFPVNSHNYCAVQGSASGYFDAAKHTVMEFRSGKLLDGNRLYYVIIKGDENYASSTGVTNLWGIGMIDSVNNGNKTFNGINYDNSHIISFTTLTEQAKNNGVCLLDHVTVEPSSYLFQTNENDANESDNPNDKSFDSVADSDKAFVSFPWAANGQILNPLTGVYDWQWFWNSDNTSIADEVPGILTDNKRLIRASKDITDGRTVEHARAHITDTIFGTGVTDITGAADIYVFVCANPWPPVSSAGLWAPWLDSGSNCTVGAPCVNTNYEMYYCRDNGSYGTYDDLPGIRSQAPGGPVIMGNSPTTGLLKEAYYFRENTPTATSGLSALNDGKGGTVKLSWPAVNDPQVTIAGYKIYWGRSSGNYTGYMDVGNLTATSVSGLIDGQKYYFNFSSYSDKGQESKLFGEVFATPLDTIPPGVPTALTWTSATGTAEISWNAVSDADSYAIAYGTAQPGLYGFVSNIGNETKIKVSDLISGKTYYFAAVAIDKAGNRATSSPINVLVK